MYSEVELRKIFEKWFENEDPWSKRNTFNDKIYKLNVSKYLDYHYYNKVLDLGCGEGDFTQLIAKKAKSVKAVDISSKAIDRAKIKFSKENIEYICSGALEFVKQEKNRYDLIFCLEMLYYLEQNEQEILLYYLSKILENNGVLYLGLVVGGDNQYGEYFTYESAFSLINKYFKIINVTTAVPKSFNKIPLIKLPLKVLSLFKKYQLIQKIISTFLDPKRHAYQANFICVKL
jgi:ubiquinone/menaquinone biosynthesis C-methylase UbiE